MLKAKTINELRMERGLPPILWGNNPPELGRSDLDVPSDYEYTGDVQYNKLASDIIRTGKHKTDRTGTGTISKFGTRMEFDLSKGFPLLTGKKIHFKSIKGELLWFISGSSSAAELREKYGVTIWDEWQDENGNLGPVYGVQWRSWAVPNGDVYYGDDCEPYMDNNYIDQLAEVIEQIKTNPDSRRLIVSAWNVGEIEQMALPPCHLLFQFYVEPLAEGEEKRRLSCQLYQRSADLFLGVPFNIASYALLVHMIAQVCDMDVGRFIWTGGDTHIYKNHEVQIMEQITRPPKESPKIWLNPDIKNIDDFSMDDIKIVDYNPHPAIKGEVSV